MFLILYRPNGDIQSLTYYTGKDTPVLPENGLLFEKLPIPEEQLFRIGYVRNGELCARPQKPDNDHMWSETDGWVPDLEKVRASQWLAIKKEREEGEASGFVFEGNRYSTDFVSQQRILLKALAAQQDEFMVVDWTTQDNQQIKLSSAQIIEVAQELEKFLNGWHLESQEARRKLALATTVEQVRNVVLGG